VGGPVRTPLLRVPSGGRGCHERRSAPSTTPANGPSGQGRVWAAGRRSGRRRSTRFDHTNRLLDASLGVVPGQGHDPGPLAHRPGWFERGKGFFRRPRRGTPQGGGDQSSAPQTSHLHGLEHAAGSPPTITARPSGPATPSRAPRWVIRYDRRYGSRSATLPSGQGRNRSRPRPGRMAGNPPRVGPSTRDQNPNRAPVPQGFDFSGVQRPPATAPTTADQNHLRAGDPANPGTASAPKMRHNCAGSNAAAVLGALTPIIRGWTAYYRGRGVVQGRFKSLDKLPVDTHLQMCHNGAHPQQAEKRGFAPATLLRRSSTSFQERPLWAFGRTPASRRPYLIKFFLDRHRPAHSRSPVERPPTDPAPWRPELPGPPRRRRNQTPRWTATTLAPCLTRQNGRCPLLRGRTALRRSATTITPTSGKRWWAADHPEGDSPPTTSSHHGKNRAHRAENTNPPSHTPPANREHQGRRHRSTATCNPQAAPGPA